jgi:hypothetical protein
MSKSHFLLAAVAAFAAGSLGWTLRGAADSQKVYELRTYTTLPGKLPDLQARFRDHTIKLFEKHGMTNIGYWVPADEPAKSNTLVYMLAHKNREAAQKSWDAFRSDPAWKEVQSKSEAPGKIVDKIVSVYLDPTDYSQLK